jgi:hypothetical protein
MYSQSDSTAAEEGNGKSYNASITQEKEKEIA